ncbi:MAG: ATP-binding protein [Spirulina sp. SIO3F2]|nr:ATP-binding protein [Spirulina sp. SIO3F2]
MPIAAHPQILTLQQQAASLLLYQGVLADPVGQAFLALLRSLQSPADPEQCVFAYGQWFRAIAKGSKSWAEHLIERILLDDNPFSQHAQQSAGLAPTLRAAAQQDLETLYQLAQISNATQLSQWVQQAANLAAAPIAWSVPPSATSNIFNSTENWSTQLPQLITHYQQAGVGQFAQYRALHWQGGHLQGITHPDPIRLAQLAGYESQKSILKQNTEFLLAGHSALHVLLYGARGSGKSSLVKALVNEWGDRGLRLVEVLPSQLADLPQVIDPLRAAPQKFIIFVDDLSFEADDERFKGLKVVLEGNATAPAPNVVVYATSNRRHLIREFFDDRPRPSDADEIHHWDTVQEKLSFSDRFGLTLTFEPAGQDTYLAIVRHLAQQVSLPLAPEQLEYEARQWAKRHNGRSGRTAQQFITHWQAQLVTPNARKPLDWQS